MNLTDRLGVMRKALERCLELDDAFQTAGKEGLDAMTITEPCGTCGGSGTSRVTYPANAPAEIPVTATPTHLCPNNCDNGTVSRTLESLCEEVESALEFYADPETYFAIGFFPDSPAGPFMDDFEETEFLGMKPGKQAREILLARGVD